MVGVGSGWIVKVLVALDYSQIELRVLAHIAGIDQLKKAFADGLDIHAMTASEMFDTPVEGMDPSIRRGRVMVARAWQLPGERRAHFKGMQVLKGLKGLRREE